ncbi:MAG: hypothetical protein R2827_09460 [Bdellovibrionales bacterium]
MDSFFVELNDIVVVIQEKYKVSFEIPVLSSPVSNLAQVVKTYDTYRPPSQIPVNADGSPAPQFKAVRLAESTFRSARK